MKSGFVYLWYDKKRKKFYLGSHLGLPTDGYTGSNRRFKSAHKSRPESFKRRILEHFDSITSKELLEKEQKWLNLIKPQQLSSKYYNEKKVAAGGDIISFLSEDKKKKHSLKFGLASKKYWENITPEDYDLRKKKAFGGNDFNREYLTQRNKELCSKSAIIKSPNGVEEVIKNISEFCTINNLNYQNFKTVLRGKRKSCNGFTGKYL